MKKCSSEKYLHTVGDSFFLQNTWPQDGFLVFLLVIAVLSNKLIRFWLRIVVCYCFCLSFKFYQNLSYHECFFVCFCYCLFFAVLSQIYQNFCLLLLLFVIAVSSKSIIPWLVIFVCLCCCLLLFCLLLLPRVIVLFVIATACYWRMQGWILVLSD